MLFPTIPIILLSNCRRCIHLFLSSAFKPCLLAHSTSQSFSLHVSMELTLGQLLWAFAFVTFVMLLFLALRTVFQNWTLYHFELKRLPRAPFPSRNPLNILFRGHNLLKHVFEADSSEAAHFFNSIRRVLDSDTFAVVGPSLTPNVIVFSEAGIRMVAQNSSVFVKPWSVNLFLDSFVGYGSIFVSEGSRHRRLRQTISTALKHDNLQELSRLFVKRGEALAEELAKARDVDPVLSIRRATFEIIISACFGENVVDDETGDRILHLYHTTLAKQTALFLVLVLGYMGIPFNPPRWLFAGERRKFELRRKVRQLCSELLARRKVERESEGTRPIANDITLLAIMCDACEDGLLSTEDLVQTVLSFLLAGQATTTLGTGWALYYLAANQNWQARVHDEIKNSWKPTDETSVLDELPLLDRFVKETIRLRPPVQSALRKTVKEVRIEGYCIPAETMVRVPISAIQRQHKFWGADADIFNPDRFIRLDKLPETRWMWMPFWFGTHSCVGQRFAMLEIKALIATILLKFHISPNENAKLQPILSESDQLKDVLKLHYSARAD